MVQEGHITTINTLLYSIEEQTIEMHGKVKILLGRCFEDPLSWWYKILFYNAQILFSVISSWFCPLEDFFFPHYLLHTLFTWWETEQNQILICSRYFTTIALFRYKMNRKQHGYIAGLYRAMARKFMTKI